jgi:hypothetical protein
MLARIICRLRRSTFDCASALPKAEFSPKTIWNYVQVVKMVVASAVGDDGEELYPRKWNHEFMDLPTVAGQRTPTFTSEQVQQIVLRADGQFAVLYALLAATASRSSFPGLSMLGPRVARNSRKMVTPSQTILGVYSRNRVTARFKPAWETITRACVTAYG